MMKSIGGIFSGLFKKHNNALEGIPESAKAGGGTMGEGALPTAEVRIPDELCIGCPTCKKMFFRHDLEKNLFVCPECGTHFRMGARARIAYLADADSFAECNGELTSENPLAFPDYEEKLRAAEQKSGEKEGVVTGLCTVGGTRCALFCMEPDFMMGSMGTVVGDKLARLFETATAEGLPVIGTTVSGGARMQEGILSLMQMAKVSGAVKRHSDAGNFYAVLLTDPTSGGVTASFAMLADVILAEPNALICFAGPRVIEQTIRQRLPDGFQHAEFVLRTGFLDAIVPRKEQKNYFGKLLKIHAKREEA